jgi:hypothetical protein
MSLVMLTSSLIDATRDCLRFASQLSRLTPFACLRVNLVNLVNLLERQIFIRVLIWQEDRLTHTGNVQLPESARHR